jgi:hypothetical protein
MDRRLTTLMLTVLPLVMVGCEDENAISGKAMSDDAVLRGDSASAVDGSHVSDTSSSPDQMILDFSTVDSTLVGDAGGSAVDGSHVGDTASSQDQMVQDFSTVDSTVVRDAGHDLSSSDAHPADARTIQADAACQPRPEVCNEIDDDCDGRSDERPIDANIACQTGRVGQCAAGVSVCESGILLCPLNIQPQEERCDARDNDCDGLTDEHVAGLEQACDTDLPGVCSAGVRSCVAGQIACVPNGVAANETCDTVDEDCDGLVDEDAQGSDENCDPGWARQDCPRQATTQCRNGQMVCEPDAQPADPCNGQDDDCDGRIGEDILGMPCQAQGLGRCQLGSLVCEPGGQVCSPFAEPECEQENNDDDDCDGRIDEMAERFCGPPEMQLTRFCLEDNNQFIGLDMYVDERGEIYVSKGSLVQGHLYFSHVHRDGTQTRTRIQSRIAIFPNRPLSDSDLIMFQGRPHVCFQNARLGGLYVSQRDANDQWTSLQVSEANDAGTECALGIHNGLLVMAYRQAGQLWFTQRMNDGNWQSRVVDAPDGAQVGAELDLMIDDNVPYISHRDETGGRFRLTFLSEQGWQTHVGPASANGLGTGTGFRPILARVADQILVLYGNVPLTPDVSSDGNFFVSQTSVPPSGQFRTEQLDAEGHGGGQALFAYGSGYLAIGRYRLRSALGFREDGLNLYKLTETSTVRVLESHSAADRRRTFTRLSMQPDPFGLPIIAFADEGGAFGDDGFGRVCFYRPSDLDQDHVPDVIELEQGTNPDIADTDGDGRSDGEEILIDFTDPLAP